MSPRDPKNDGGQKAEEGAENGEFARLLAESERSLKEGELIRGRVLQVTNDEILVDIGYKSEGMIPRSEFHHVPADRLPHPGQEIEAVLERTEGPNGYVVLSYEKARRGKAWDIVEQAFAANAPIRGRVLERVKGGLSVDIGVRAFLPGSIADSRPLKNLDVLKGRELEFRVVSLDKKRGNIVLSRKAILDEVAEVKKKEAAAALADGRVLKGVVKNLTDYGAFVDLGGIDGLLHVTDMTWGRLAHPSDAVHVGQEVEVKVLRFEEATGRISLGMKQLKPDPWHDLPAHYPVGARVRGKVVSLTDYGAFVELEEGVEGLIHVSEMSWTKRVKNPSKLLNVGDTIEAVIADVNPETRRLSLSLRATEPNPWEQLAEKYHIGDRIHGTVRNLTDFGAFVEIEEGIDGLIHVSDMSWGRRVKHPSEILKKGDEVQAVLTAIDVENRRISLSIKEFRPERVGGVLDEAPARRRRGRHGREGRRVRRVRAPARRPRGPHARFRNPARTRREAGLALRRGRPRARSHPPDRAARAAHRPFVPRRGTARPRGGGRRGRSCGAPPGGGERAGEGDDSGRPRDALNESVETDEKAVPAGTDPHE